MPSYTGILTYSVAMRVFFLFFGLFLTCHNTQF
nr:MAG TPA: hypothetical protein [Caudoviricetes sp.]